MNRHNGIDTAMVAFAFGIFGCLCIYMSQYSDHPTVSAVFGVASLAITSFIAGYMNGGR